MPQLIGKNAPVFHAQAVQKGEIIQKFSLEDLKGDYVCLFFYPLDFTFVCPTELHAFQDKLEEFTKRGCHVVGCSVDSPYSHQAWMATPREKGGIAGTEYPIISDLNKNIARDYNVLIPEEGIAYRGLYLIDKQGIIRHQLINDLPLGRSVDETLRTLDALIFVEQHGQVCPANWKQGEKSMTPSQEGLETFFATT